MKKVFLSLFLSLGLAACFLTNARAGELDILLDKLVQKGVLSPIEATIIKDETKQAVAADVTAGKSYAVPTWVQKMKIKGDVRLRYQYERNTSDTEARTRGRVRARLGFDTKVTDKVYAGIGIASGGSDPRSTNQTFQDTFSTKGINLDYAYGKYVHNSNFSMIAGKFKRKPWLWAPTDLLWDGDINPEGFSMNLNRNLFGDVDGWLNAGVWILDENGKSDEMDPFMKYVQGGLKFKEGIFDGKFSTTYYDFQGIEDRALDNTGGTNTGSAGPLLSTYNTISLSTELGMKKPFGGLPFKIDERIAIFGEFVRNTDDRNSIDDNVTGHALGFKLGNKKVKKPGQWQLKYVKAKLGKDAWLDTFPDSDRLGGDTDVESHEIALKYALKKNLFLGVDYYKSWSMSDPADKQHLVQGDVLFKF